MRFSNYLPDDGYTENGYIEAIAGLHAEMRFRYRPLLAEQRGQIMRQLEGLKEEEQVVRIAPILARQLQEWDLRLPDGSPVAIRESSVRRLRPAVFYRLWGIVTGTVPSDLDPRWSDDEKQSAVELLLEAGPVGDARERRNEKN
ncbi:MAG: hypothetical protein IMZ55_05620 [Acidobacteria bacterium]|nr:hypothetical protein [Acidobacteriota bacterium]